MLANASFSLSGETLKPGKPLTRVMAAAIHLTISCVLAGVVLLGMLFVFYPSPYFQAVGGLDLLTILVGVDVVLGPMITLIIFNPKKKELKRDLTIIGLIQLTALIYGAYAMIAARPVFTVFSQDKFMVLTANNIEDELLRKAIRPEFKQLPAIGPLVVAIKEPLDKKERENLMFAQALGAGIQYMPQYYVPYKEAASDVLQQAKPLAVLQKQQPTAYAAVMGELPSMNRDEASVVFLPMTARKQVMTVLIDAKSGAIIKIMPVSPWK